MESPPSSQTKFSLDPDNMFLSGSNKLENMPPGILKRIQTPAQDLPSLLASIGLEKYIRKYLRTI